MAEGSELTLTRGMANLTTSSADDTYVLLAAIDFGTTFSGYAFSFKTNPGDIKINKEWGNEVGAKSYKTPTCVLTDNDDRFISFGYDAMNRYSREVDADKRFHFYDRFKMALYREKVISSKTTIISRSGRSLPAETIISLALNYMYNHILQAIKDTDAGEIDRSFIRWVLTVPAIWSEGAKQLMRRAAFKAGIIDSISSKRLIIALEAEAASFWCRSLPLKQFSGSDVTEKSVPSNAKYMILDCGGGTVDITVHEMTSRGVKEIHRANGGDWGGTKVDENFLMLMDDLLGETFTKMYRTKYPQDWLNFLVNFETAKRGFASIESKSINLTLSYVLGEAVEEEFGKSLRKFIKDAQLEGVSFSQGMLVLEPGRVAKLFDPVISKVVGHISELFKNAEVRDVGYIFLVGGFSECHVLSWAIREKFGVSSKVLVPQDAGMSVMKGAVLFGHTPQTVVSRIARKTYGQGVSKSFKDGVHDSKYKIVLEGKDYCDKLLQVWIKMNESVEVGSCKTFVTGVRDTKTTKSTKHIYSVDRKDVMYSTEPGVEEIGNISISTPDTHLPWADRKTKTYVYFGDTEMHIRVEDASRPDGDTGELTIDFLGQ